MGQADKHLAEFCQNDDSLQRSAALHDAVLYYLGKSSLVFPQILIPSRLNENHEEQWEANKNNPICTKLILLKSNLKILGSAKHYIIESIFPPYKRQTLSFTLTRGKVMYRAFLQLLLWGDWKMLGLSCLVQTLTRCQPKDFIYGIWPVWLHFLHLKCLGSSDDTDRSARETWSAHRLIPCPCWLQQEMLSRLQRKVLVGVNLALLSTAMRAEG